MEEPSEEKEIEIWNKLHEIFTGDELDVLRDLVSDMCEDIDEDNLDPDEDWKNIALLSLDKKFERPHDYEFSTMGFGIDPDED